MSGCNSSYFHSFLQSPFKAKHLKPNHLKINADIRYESERILKKIKSFNVDTQPPMFKNPFILVKKPFLLLPYD
jgi:hypothetical protein